MVLSPLKVEKQYTLWKSDNVLVKILSNDLDPHLGIRIKIMLGINSNSKDNLMIFHIGYPKCGSTFIQQVLLNEHPSYFGRHYKNKQSGLSKQISEFLLFNNTEKPSMEFDVSGSVFSNELLSFPTGFVSNPQNMVRSTRSEVFRKMLELDKNSSVVLILRKKEDLLKSLYQQSKWANLTNDCWQRWLEKFLNKSDVKENLDYCRTIEELIQLFPHVHVLSLDDLNANNEKFNKAFNTSIQIDKYHSKVNVRPGNIGFFLKQNVHPFIPQILRNKIPRNFVDVCRGLDLIKGSNNMPFSPSLHQEFAIERTLTENLLVKYGL